ncbi:MAG: TonB-dependent receptor [Bacteroidales bacterium]|nr:TonB-dependent receptor [Bacteroidales bacterium]
MKKLLSIVWLLGVALVLTGQTRPSMQGKVICRNTGEPVMMATVVVKELNIWATTNDSGEFVLRNVPSGTYTLVVSCLGFIEHEHPVTFPVSEEKVTVLIDEATLAIEDVVVTAKEGRRIASGSVIEQSAIQHVQPTDLSDVLQLLPGQTTLNPDLSKPKQLTVREIIRKDGYIGDNMASLGTLLIVDGAPVSNDANMQFLKTTGASTGVTAGFATTASGGTDVRQIAVDNIETIEVVRGIAGVENGDMLSGAVKVTMKKGKTPFTAKIKTDPGIKQFYGGKGLSLGDRAGTLNLDFDYTQSFDDIRVKYKTFNRLNGGLIYNNTLFREIRPLTLSLSARGSQTLDISKNDPDMLDIEDYEAKDQGLSMNLNAKWAMNSAVLTNLNLMVSGNIQHQVGHEVTMEEIPSGAQPQPIAYESGENQVPILPSSYISDLTIDGRPYYYNTRLSGNRSFNIGKVLNNIVAGVEYRLIGNNGLGRVYDLSRPPVPVGGTDARPRSYKDIPSLGQLAYYAEENLGIPIGKTRLDLQAGLRFTNVQPEGIFRSKEQTTMLDPRFNTRFTVIDNGKGAVSHLALRGGYGLFSKAPSLLYLYPDRAYWDKTGLSYYDPVAQRGLFVVTTKIFENPRNENLVPAVNRKIEGGFDLTLNDIDLNVTLYSEKMENGFSFERYYENFIFNRYTQPLLNGLELYFVPGSGVFYLDPVSGTEVQLPAVQDTVFVSFTYPGNGTMTTKKGVEFTLDLGTFRALRTSFIIDGAWMTVKRQTTVDDLTKPSSGSIGGKEFPMVALYPAGYGSIDKRFNTNIRTITHIRELRMVASVTTQIIWMDRDQSVWDDPDGNPMFYTNPAVDDPYADKLLPKYVDPLGYYDRQMVYHEFDRTLAVTKPYSDLIKRYNTPWYFAETGYPPYFVINFKLTKEITDKANFSFYANNISNHNPLIKQRGGAPEVYARRNPPLYFGAELKIKF